MYSGGNWKNLGNEAITLDIQSNGKLELRYEAQGTKLSGTWKVVNDAKEIEDREYQYTDDSGKITSFSITPVMESESSDKMVNKVLFFGNAFAFESNPSR